MKLDTHVLEERMAAFAAACRRRGIRSTHQRSVIYRELARSLEHPDVETLFKRVRRRLPTVSLDTVYRTVRLLESSEIITRVGCHHERARYDANLERHHHFVCTDCGAVHDLYSPELDAVSPPGCLDGIGEASSVCVELRGTCATCGGGARARKTLS